MEIHLAGHLGFYGPQQSSHITMHLDTPVRLIDLLARLRVPVAEVAVAALNGAPVEIDNAIIRDADRLDLLPPIGGGTSPCMGMP